MQNQISNEKIVILDRDGVINFDSDQFIKSPNEFKLIPNSLESIAKLNQHGIKVVIATNQSGIGRGLFDMDTLNLIHQKLNSELAKVGGKIEAIFFCPHIDSDNCDCRKPKSGMFLEISEAFGISLNGIFAVGDSLRDLQASANVGCQPILVLTGKGKSTLKNAENAENDPQKALPKNTKIFDDLHKATDYIIQNFV